MASWRGPRRVGGASFSVAALAVLLALHAHQSQAAADSDPGAKPDAGQPDAQQNLGALVRVSLPISSGADAKLKLTLTRARDRLLTAARTARDGRRPLLVLEIAPATSAAGAGAGSQFEAAFSLARFLTSREMADVKTVAWVPRSIRGHGALVALACEEMVMAPEAEIGEAGVDEPAEGAVSPTVVAAYREIADRRTIPAALAVAIVDPSVEAVQVESEQGVRVLLASEVDEFRQEHEVINEQQLVAAGTLGRFTGREAWQFGFVKYLADDRNAVARALSLSRESLKENQSLDASWHAVVLDLRGEVTRRSVSELTTLLGNEIQRGANLVAIRIDSVGGDAAASIELATTLADLDPNMVRTVAYVPVEARGAAAVVALACDQLAMHAEAKLGAGPRAAAPPPQDNRALPPPRGPNWRRPVEPPAGDDAPPVDLAAAATSIRESLAPRTDRSWSLLAAMIDPAAEVYQYRDRTTGDVRLLNAEEVRELPNAADWTRGEPLHRDNQPVLLTGDQAAELGVVWNVVESFDQLEQLYGVKFREVKPNWAITLIQALASPGLATFLLFLGFIGIWVEIKTPGVGVGGMVAAVAFILFFWSHYLDQTAGSLEILMFVCGLVLMLIEVFVLPGFGIFGLGGGLMVIFSLILASQTVIIPTTEADMLELRRSVTVVAAAGIGMVAFAIATRRLLPKAPLLNRMVLQPPPPEERITLSHREAIADYSDLVGVEGEATTHLRPSGKALIDGRLIDVITDGLPLDRGTPLVVVAAHAHRVVVRERP